MLVAKSPLITHHTKIEKTNIADLYFFKNYVIAEFYEGVEIDYLSFEQCQTHIKKYFGENDFGFISNRINSYSVVITEAYLFNKAFPNVKAYATVSYNVFTQKSFEVESHFFKFNKRNFLSLTEAVSWVESTLKN
ncbi:hypothetical protein JJL45_12670 [Tamlana sp. s12]|uniref:hypothetical protein n=1 Tax=Tamlana sp. s12 TaxID=1630406 RepID=UPI0007FC3313|nr:hypothetical protein [Tamlana sp. s12]OBQ56595.1 hypothetical protein VQ01_04425 [Tamlana sp. s12]QQY81768.1 hypothetical protein JJL45_12670 [Tamlana sp. s12]